jgi:protease PrsW
MASTALPPPARPVAQTGGVLKALLITAAILSAVVLGLLMLLLLGFSTGPVGLVVGMVLATLPVPIYMLLALWIDRLEKEPVWMLVTAFIWGATAAVYVAFILNTVFSVIMTSAVGEAAEMATAVVSAPFVEELAKGFALFVFFFWRRDEFDNVLDGIIYAAMVGLGFAMTENILYYGKALAAEGVGGSVVTFILRGVVSPFAHPLFTSMTGIGLGIARTARQGSPLKFLAPLVGLGMAMFLHFIWNFSASFGAMFFAAYIMVMVPAFLGVVAIIIFSLRKEGRIMREQLLPEMRSGLLPDREYSSVCTVSGRIGGALRAFASGGWKRSRARMRLHDAASELAFHRWRTARGIVPRRESVAEREGRHLAQLNAAAAYFGWGATAAVGAGAPFSPPPLPHVIKTAPAPRSGGSVGAAFAMISVGCLGMIVLGVLGLGAAVYIAAETGITAPVIAGSNALEKAPLEDLLPPALGDSELENATRLDDETRTMFGAVEGARGSYAENMSLLLLRYRSAEAAGEAVEPLRSALFPTAAGWKITALESADDPALRAHAVRSRAGQSAAMWNYGLVVMVFAADTPDVAKFDAAAEVLKRGEELTNTEPASE